jgi:hypothetical protein
VRRSVYKYEVRAAGGFDAVEMPPASAIVEVAVQNHRVFVWALVIPSEEKVDRNLGFFGTGQPIPGGAEYIGSGHDPFGLVWHVFEGFSDDQGGEADAFASGALGAPEAASRSGAGAASVAAFTGGGGSGAGAGGLRSEVSVDGPTAGFSLSSPATPSGVASTSARLCRIFSFDYWDEPATGGDVA